MSEEIENRLNEKFGYFAILGGERFYNGCFDPSTKTMEVAEFIKNEVSEAITLTEERVRKEKDEEFADIVGKVIFSVSMAEQALRRKTTTKYEKSVVIVSALEDCTIALEKLNTARRKYNQIISPTTESEVSNDTTQ